MFFGFIVNIQVYNRIKNKSSFQEKKMLSQRPIQQTPILATREKVQISRLINSILYSIKYVFIVKKSSVYRLFALHNRRVLIDKTYKTMRGAKIAFGKSYHNERIKAEWSDLYQPNSQWLDEKLKIAEKTH
jgi:hypothetical protein